jgi:hypothetical protein
MHIRMNSLRSWVPGFHVVASRLVSLKGKRKSLISRALGMGEELLYPGKA